MQQALVFYSMYQVENADIMRDSIKDTNTLLMELDHEYRLILASYKDVNALKNLEEMVKHLRSYTIEICVAASNAATYMTSWKSYMDMFMQNNDDDVKKTALKQATIYKLNLDQYREKLTFEEKENVANAISDYLVLLCRLFKVDFNINYEIPIIEPVIKE